MYHLIHKNYSLNIVVRKKFLWFKWKKTIKIQYGQAKIIDLIKFSTVKSQDEEIVWLIRFLEEHSKNMRKSDYGSILNQFGEISLYLKDTFWKRDLKKFKDDGINAPYSSHIAFLAKELCETPHNIINDYTIEEADYLSEGIVRNMNQQTTEGQKRNELKAIEESAKNTLSENGKMINDFLKD